GMCVGTAAGRFVSADINLSRNIAAAQAARPRSEKLRRAPSYHDHRHLPIPDPRQSRLLRKYRESAAPIPRIVVSLALLKVWIPEHENRGYWDGIRWVGHGHLPGRQWKRRDRRGRGRREDRDPGRRAVAHLRARTARNGAAQP